MMLQRNLLYTALTRARKRAVIVVSGGLENIETGRIYKTALEVAVANDKIAQRYSGRAAGCGLRPCARLRPTGSPPRRADPGPRSGPRGSACSATRAARPTTPARSFRATGDGLRP